MALVAEMSNILNKSLKICDLGINITES